MITMIKIEIIHQDKDEAKIRELLNQSQLTAAIVRGNKTKK